MLTETQTAMLEDAMERHIPVQIAYRDKEGERTERVITPQSVTADSRHLTAWCHKREGLRHFRLDRIEMVQAAEGQPQVVEGPDDELSTIELPEMMVMEWFEVKASDRGLPDWMAGGRFYTDEGGWFSWQDGWLAGEGRICARQACELFAQLCGALEDVAVVNLEREDRLPGFRLRLTPQGPAREDGHLVRLTAAAVAA